MPRDLVAGIDSSTQSGTVVLRRIEDGAVVGEARKPHPPTTPPRSEQPPEAWWQALRAAFADLADFVPRIAAVSGVLIAAAFLLMLIMELTVGLTRRMRD